MNKTEIKENIPSKEPAKIVSWLVSCAFFMQMIDSTILNTALPDIAKSIHEKPLKIQSIIVAYLLTVAFFLPVSGWFASKFGAKKVFTIAIGIFTVGSLFSSLSTTLYQLVSSRIFQGVGAALMVPTGRLIVLEEYPRDKLLKVLSFIMLPALFGPILGPPLGGFFVEYLSWHWIFLINIPIGIITILLTIIYMPEIPKDNKIKLDWLGFFYLSISIVLMCLATDKTNSFITSVYISGSMAAASLILIAMFWFHIKKAKTPLFHPDLVKVRLFSVGIIGNLGGRLGFSAMPLLIPLMLQVALGVSPAKSGFIMLSFGIASVIGKMFVEKAVKFMGYKWVLILTTFLVGVFTCGLLYIDRNSTDVMIMSLLFVIGAINSIQFTAMNTVTLIDLPKKYDADGNSLLAIVTQISMVLGISIGSSILNIYEEIYEYKHVLHAFHTTFLIIGVFTIISSIIFFFIPKKIESKKAVDPLSGIN